MDVIINAFAFLALKFYKFSLSFCHILEPMVGLEPTTFPLPWECSTN